LKVKTKIVDKGAKHILKEMYKIKKGYNFVTIGLHKDVKYPSGKSVGDVAMELHEGTRSMPARPFLRREVNNNLSIYKKLEIKILNKIFKGKSAKLALSETGTKIAIDVRRSIATAPSWAAPLSAESLISKTGRLLFESGTLFRSVGYQITENNKQENIKGRSK